MSRNLDKQILSNHFESRFVEKFPAWVLLSFWESHCCSGSDKTDYVYCAFTDSEGKEQAFEICSDLNQNDQLEIIDLNGSDEDFPVSKFMELFTTSKSSECVEIAINA